MKTNDLMIGDLVCVTKDVCIKKDTIVEVRCIDADNAFIEKELKGCATCINKNDRCNYGGVWVEYLAPIPLTIEILEKNGFEKDGSVFYIAEDYYDIEIKEYSDSIWVVLVTDNELGIPDSKFTISHVHELQHALRLCGLSDLADNFKI